MVCEHSGIGLYLDLQHGNTKQYIFTIDFLVGSLHGDRNYAVADLVRSQMPLDSDAANTNIELFIPNQTGKVVVVSLIMRGTEYCRSKVFITQGFTIWDFPTWHNTLISRLTHLNLFRT